MKLEIQNLYLPSRFERSMGAINCERCIFMKIIEKGVKFECISKNMTLKISIMKKGTCDDIQLLVYRKLI